MVLKGYFYVGVSLCSLCESNIFGVRAFLSLDAYHIFPQCVLAIITLIGGVIGVVTQAALDVERGVFFALWLSQPCLGQGLLPSCWSRGSQISF